MSVTFTAILGVAGRPVFKNMLDSLQRNMTPGDQTIVVIDSHKWEPGQEPVPMDEVKTLVCSYGQQFEVYDHDAGFHFQGAPQLQWAFDNVQINGSHVLCLADDDVLTDGAYDAYRAQLELNSDRPLLPRFVCPFGIEFANGQIHGDGRCILWDIPRMAIVRITSAIVLARRHLQPWPQSLDCCNDYYWMETVLKAAVAEGHAPVWLDFVSIIARPTRDWPEDFGEPGHYHRGVWICDACNARDAGAGWGFVEHGTTCACGREGRTTTRTIEGVVA